MADSSYVQMGNDGPRAGNVSALVPGLDDPNLSQEEKDYRLAIALQQQENAAVQAAKKKHDASVAVQHTRVSRSGVNTALAHIRKQQKSGDAGGAYSPTSSGDYYAPDDGSADAQLARKIQNEEMEAAGEEQRSRRRAGAETGARTGRIAGQEEQEEEEQFEQQELVLEQ